MYGCKRITINTGKLTVTGPSGFYYFTDTYNTNSMYLQFIGKSTINFFKNISSVINNQT